MLAPRRRVLCQMIAAERLQTRGVLPMLSERTPMDDPDSDDARTDVVAVQKERFQHQSVRPCVPEATEQLVHQHRSEVLFSKLD